MVGANIIQPWFNLKELEKVDVKLPGNTKTED